MNRITNLNTEILLLSLLQLRRSKGVMPTLAVLSLFLLGAEVSHAAHRQFDLRLDHRIVYRAPVGHDLDGDHKPETATIRQAGYLYQLSIQFTTGRPKVHFTTYITEGIAGLSFQTADIDNDSKRDLVVISATSSRPIAIWLNEGRARFRKINSSFYAESGRYTGPAYGRQKTSQPEPVGNINIDPLPQAAPMATDLGVDDEAVALLPLQPDQQTFDPLLPQVPPRGPPATAYV